MLEDCPVLVSVCSKILQFSFLYARTLSSYLIAVFNLDSSGVCPEMECVRYPSYETAEICVGNIDLDGANVPSIISRLSNSWQRARLFCLGNASGVELKFK